MTDDTLHDGWTEAHLRDVLPRTSERVQDVLRYIAQHPDSTGQEIGEALGLAGSHGVGQALKAMIPLGVPGVGPSPQAHGQAPTPRTSQVWRRFASPLRGACS